MEAVRRGDEWRWGSNGGRMEHGREVMRREIGDGGNKTVECDMIKALRIYRLAVSE